MADLIHAGERAQRAQPAAAAQSRRTGKKRKKTPVLNTNGVQPHVETGRDTNPGDASRRRADTAVRNTRPPKHRGLAAAAAAAAAAQMEGGRDGAGGRPSESPHSK